MIFIRAFIIWVLIICAETIHGILRTLLLAPITGDFRARQIAVFTGSLIIFTITYFSIRWINAVSKVQLFTIGLFWLILTVSFEIALGRFILNFNWERILSDYDLAKGGLLSIGLVFMIFSPFLAAKLRRLI